MELVHAVTKRQLQLHRRACNLLGVDPARIVLLGPTDFRLHTGGGTGYFLGRAAWGRRDGTPVEPPAVYVSRTAGYDTHVHEVLHVLFRSRPHWWIYAATARLAGRSGGVVDPVRAAAQYLDYGRRTLEPRAKLIRLASAAATKHGLGVLTR